MNKTEKLATALYASIHRISWTFWVGWLIYTCHHLKSGGIANWFLSLSFWQPFSKLSLSIYLVHDIYIVMSVAVMKERWFLEPFWLFHIIFGDLVISTLLGLVLYLMVEAPMNVILRNYVKSWTTNQKLNLFKKNFLISKLFKKERPTRFLNTSLKIGFSILIYPKLFFSPIIFVYSTFEGFSSADKKVLLISVGNCSWSGFEQRLLHNTKHWKQMNLIYRWCYEHKNYWPHDKLWECQPNHPRERPTNDDDDRKPLKWIRSKRDKSTTLAWKKPRRVKCFSHVCEGTRRWTSSCRHKWKRGRWKNSSMRHPGWILFHSSANICSH